MIIGEPITIDLTQSSQGPAGLSAYEIAVKNGFSGTVQEWLASLGSSVDQFPVAAGAPTTPIPAGVFTYLDTLTGNLYKNISGAWNLVYTFGQQILNSFNADYNGDFS